MSKYQQKEGDIAIFAVKEKKNPKGQDWTGKALVNGKEMQVSFWQKTPTMLAGQIKEKYQSDYTEAKQAAQSGVIPGYDDSDSIPF